MTSICHMLLVFLTLREAFSNPLPKPRPFKCAGDTDRVCETGWCYDSLGFYEGGRNVGCATFDMCSEVGCHIYKDVFTCCCSTRFCNGKTESLMWSKFRKFKDNNNVWPTFFPRLHVRNVTSVPEGSEPRAAAQKATTSFNKQPTTMVYTGQTSLPEYTTAPTEKRQPVQYTTALYKNAATSPEASTTKNITPPSAMTKKNPTTVEGSKATTQSNKRVENVAGQAQRGADVVGGADAMLATSTMSSSTTAQIVSSSQIAGGLSKPDLKLQEISEALAAKAEGNEDEDADSEDSLDATRTTRSNPQRGRATSAAPQPRRPHPTFIPATKPPQSPPKQRETHPAKPFPWYYVTIIGFVISCATFVMFLCILRRIRHSRMEQRRRQSEDSLPNSSLESSRVSDMALRANETAKDTADPLLTGKRP